VALTAADRVTLDMVGDGLISINVEQAALNASVVNAAAGRSGVPFLVHRYNPAHEGGSQF
jgi:hypothetical protein